ncbi:MAG TPA: carboxypeptidase regulatory-like domain-containing protein [Longimicrobiales bacterium]|nr:carboxypeptidase regulatory-like domain-containing protein [Longimicrobiales bacterium]
MIRSLFRRPAVSRAASFGLAAALVILLADGLTAQTLRGRVTDGRTQQPMADVAVSLLDEDANVLNQTTSGPSGGFVLQAPGPGDYYVRAERLSYTTVTDGIFVFQTESAEMSIALFMLPQPTEIQGIDVRIQQEQQRRRLRSAGFYERAAMGFGRFIGPEEISRRPVFSFSDLLRGIPGVQFNNETITFQSFNSLSGGGRCSPDIYMDGARVFQDFGITTLIQPDEVEGVEVYRGSAQTPLEWGGLNGSCGLLLIWTKSGRR